MDDRDRMYFGSSRDNSDSIGFLDEKTRAISAAAMPLNPISSLSN